MNLSISQQFWNKLFILLNSCFVIFGIVLLALGIKALETINELAKMFSGITPVIIPTAIFIGCLILVGTIIGYIGFWKPKQFIIILHIACLCLAVIIEISIATVTVTSGEKFQTAANHSVINAVKQFYRNSFLQVEMDRLQNKFRCCGATSYMDYPKSHINVPFSCFIGTLVYARGCVEAFNDYLQQYIIALISLCFVFGIIKSVYLIISIYLFKKSVTTKNVTA
ncbi:tetraspanin, putative [Schistosoma mansoni]|uniref:tetraspanin, putative n=1 Tax=Schistosoma mansoni TaxID=6183 RepID=UPI00019B3546|nr:tetraspanin, putative [Schistosoma mansoni]|eukprot:XP_018645505.1 tetraspanin, putative [Schistosoma mansoni]